VTTARVPTPALSETRALPSGVTFVHNSNDTLAGTPAAGTDGTQPDAVAVAFAGDADCTATAGTGISTVSLLTN